MDQTFKNAQTTFHGKHPSGLEDDAELSYISMWFWALDYDESKGEHTRGEMVWERLLSFQQGWKACKDFYKINE